VSGSAALAGFDTATVYEAAGGRGELQPVLRRLAGSERISGPALPVMCPAGDNLALHAAVARARPGDVLVAQCQSAQFGVWGEVLTTAAIARGVAGLVLDGAVRDIEAIRALGFSVHARGTALPSATKVGPGVVGEVVPCAGRLVWPGDVVVADASGVVVVRAHEVESVLAAAAARRDEEAALMEDLRGGVTTVERMALDLERLEGGTA
jgi:4-hydroxy-4-methyl-2-oxoglutarate aldolase